MVRGIQRSRSRATKARALGSCLSKYTAFGSWPPSRIVSEAVIVTALHVVGQDAEWMESPNGRDRNIEVFGLDANGIERSLGPAAARPVPSLDIAVRTIRASNLPEAVQADAVPSELGTLVAIISDPDSRQPEPVSADLVPTDRGRHGDNLTIRLAVLEGHSGSGVFGADGKLLGIITNQLGNTRALAAPTYLFAPFLPPRVKTRPAEEEVARCEAQERALRVNRQPFTVSSGVRCENMGDTQRNVAKYAAPPGWSIVGQVEKYDETNYGTVGPVEYHRDGARVSAMSASVQCATPNRPFGPGGWASTTLKGFIERSLTQTDLDELRRTCLAK
jgi:Trypsin-like peptidase domain